MPSCSVQLFTCLLSFSRGLSVSTENARGQRMTNKITFQECSKLVFSFSRWNSIQLNAAACSVVFLRTLSCYEKLYTSLLEKQRVVSVQCRWMLFQVLRATAAKGLVELAPLRACLLWDTKKPVFSQLTQRWRSRSHMVLFLKGGKMYPTRNCQSADVYGVA